jgi:hypothetical protein
METKHTPGPWFSNNMGLHNGIGDGIAAYAADCYPNDDDARLIAAAPDLLAALQWIADYGDTGKCGRPAYYDMRAHARAAIRKAEGR